MSVPYQPVVDMLRRNGYHVSADQAETTWSVGAQWHCPDEIRRTLSCQDRSSIDALNWRISQEEKK